SAACATCDDLRPSKRPNAQGCEKCGVEGFMPIHETTLSPWNAPGSTAPAKQSLPGPAPETSYGENKKGR
ncbi:hypothetical protein N0800_29855, partial [Pseudomonas aeruginosa]|nr:hypothetical protein [Pseudomonas aeruginosa]MCS9698218.1 hypothetical protein [Pseudomonas aeruginosa]